jgi:hypothetical protein
MTAVLLELALMRPILLQSLLQVTACAFLGGAAMDGPEADEG